jgi:hypothetical protein
MGFPSEPAATIASDKIAAQHTGVLSGRIYPMVPVVGVIGVPRSGKQDLLSSCAHPGNIAQARIVKAGRRQRMRWVI